MQVLSWNAQEDGAFSEDSLRLKISNLGYHVSRYVYSPGTYFPDHSHGMDKLDGVVSGKFKMTTPEGSVTLEAGDCLVVPRGVVHSAEVVGQEAVVSLDGTK